jgi:5-methyltetrahydropteroyltriglutamate--homocysteine methyltransferase
MLNQHYESHEAYLMALASALSSEYRAIHEAGYVLQIDSLDLAMELHIAAINPAIASIQAIGCDYMSAGATMTVRISTT